MPPDALVLALAAAGLDGGAAPVLVLLGGVAFLGVASSAGEVSEVALVAGGSPSCAAARRRPAGSASARR